MKIKSNRKVLIEIKLTYEMEELEVLYNKLLKACGYDYLPLDKSPVEEVEEFLLGIGRILRDAD